MKTLFLALSLVVSPALLLRADTETVPWNSATTVVVTEGNGIVGSVLLPEAKVQMQAENITFDKAKGHYVLSGQCAVTVIQHEPDAYGRGRHALRFAGTGANVRSMNIELQLDGGYATDVPFGSVTVLAQALKKYPQLTFFRLNWGAATGRWNVGGSALYDRKKGTLAEVASGGEEGAWIHDRYLYTGVTPEMFYQRAKQEALSTEPAHSELSFGFLTGMGARRTSVK